MQTHTHTNTTKNTNISTRVLSECYVELGNTAASLVQVQIMTNTSTRVEVPTVQDTQIQNTINTSTRVEISIVEQIQSKKKSPTRAEVPSRRKNTN